MAQTQQWSVVGPITPEEKAAGVVYKKQSELFGVQAPDSAVAKVRPRDPKLSLECYGEEDPHFIFHPLQLKKGLLFLSEKTASHNIISMGNSGIGKSAFWRQLLLRLGIPYFAMACEVKTRFSDFIGTKTLKDGATPHEMGLLPLSMIHNGVFLMEEATRASNSVQMRLAPVLDGGGVVIPDTGQAIARPACFRFIATGNSGGYGDESGSFAGEQVSSVAFIRRFMRLKVMPLTVEQQEGLVKRVAPSLPENIVKLMVSTAEAINKGFVGNGGALRFALPPSVLRTWALTACNYKVVKGIGDPIWESLEDTLLGGAPEEDVTVVQELYTNWLKEATP
ncbi:MAG: hypothetical protein D4S02_07150 [Rhodocyclaceae bacterium]|nr:MAG: hypothetical protein D4S02_07150 [Rhodocyclaceae bacterium]